MANGHDTINAVGVKLPTFYRHNPDGWFINAEAQFALSRITDERTKFFHVVKVLDMETSAEVQQFLADVCQGSDSNSTPYTTLKAKLTQIFGKRKTTRMGELLAMCSLNEHGAESTLRRMQALATDLDTMFQVKLLSMAPTSARISVAGRNFENAEDLAAAIDDAMEKERLAPDTSLPPAIASVAHDTPSSPDEDHFISSIRAAYRNAAKDNSFPKDRRPRPNICFFHTKFGSHARKCAGQQCKFFSLLQSGNAVAGN